MIVEPCPKRSISCLTEATRALCAHGQSPKTKDSSKDAKRADEVMKDAQDPPPPDSHPPPLDAVSATPPPTAAGEPALVTAVPLPEGIGGIKADSRPLSSGEKRSISMAVKAEFVNPEEVGYVHKFRWGTRRLASICVGVQSPCARREGARRQED
jgi:hypothetical protein